MAAATPEERTIDDTVEALEQRVHRLEQAVAALSDTQLMEDRVVERVVQRTETHANGGFLSGAARLLRRSPANPNVEPAELAAETPPVAEMPPAPPRIKAGWILLEFINEVRTAARMLADYRYRMSWTGRIVPLACLLAGLLSWLLISGISVVGGWVDRLFDIVLVVIFYKSMSREVARYLSGAGRVLR